LHSRSLGHCPISPSSLNDLLDCADGHNIPTSQELLDHNDVRTTVTFVHVLSYGERGVISPLEGIRDLLRREDVK